MVILNKCRDKQCWTMANAQWNTNNTDCSVQIALAVWTTYTFRNPASNLEISTHTVCFLTLKSSNLQAYITLQWVLAYHFLKRGLVVNCRSVQMICFLKITQKTTLSAKSKEIRNLNKYNHVKSIYVYFSSTFHFLKSSIY